MTLKFNLLNW